MSKGSKRPGWRTQHRIYLHITRELAAAAGIQQVKPEPKPERRIRPPAKPKPEPRKRDLNEREQAIRNWYLYGEANDEPPEGLTEAELMKVRSKI